MLYFAYGSNLDAKDLTAYCAARGQDAIEVKGEAAWLPDHRPVFHYYSQSRRGGALDIIESKGHFAAGALFELSAAQVEILDAKESAGVNYEKKDVCVVAGGALRSASTYVVRTDKREAFVAPTQDYLDIVRRGYLAFGHDAEVLAAAAEDRLLAPLRTIFVYGTLMRGECREHFVKGSATTPATLDEMELHDLGEYPGIKRSKSSRVHGELHELDPSTFEETLEILDEVEDFLGYDDLLRPAPRSMYARTIVQAVAKGASVPAWTYLLMDGFSGTTIESGDWRRR